MIGAAHLMMRAAGVSQPKGLFAWGYNSYGQLGLGDRTHRSSPVQVGALTTWSKIVGTVDWSLGLVTAFGVKSDGTLWGWGDNSGGILTGFAGNRSSPVQIGSATNWKDAGGGPSYGYDGTFGAAIGAIKTTGTLWTWGCNVNNQLGLGGGVGSVVTSPTQVGSDTNWDKVMIGDSGYAIKTTGTLWAWGDNGLGQLGLNDRTSRSSPVQVGSASGWADVHYGSSNVVALKTDGTLWAWGSNTYGQLGLGDRTHRSSPTQVGTDTNWSKIAFGQYDRTGWLAVRSDGTLWACGVANSGGTYSSPVQVGAATNWSAVACGLYHSLALNTNGALWAWGKNNYGQLGLADRTDRSSPTQVGAGTNWSKLPEHSAHWDESYGIRS